MLLESINCGIYNQMVKWQWSEDVEWLHPLDAYMTVELTKCSLSPDNQKRFVEIGSWKGGWIRNILVNNSEISGVAVDPYPGLLHIREYFLDNMKKNSLEKRIELHADLKKLNQYSFDFVHIDACHSQDSVERELEYAQSHLKAGGIIFVDDIFHPLYPGVAAAVFSFLADTKFVAFALTRNKIYLCEKKYYEHYFKTTLDIADQKKISYSLGTKIGDRIRGLYNTYATSNSIYGFPVVNFAQYSKDEIAAILDLPRENSPLSRFFRMGLRLIRVLRT